MRSGYDNIAWYYDWLARLIYGKTLVHAQQYLVAAIPANATILVAGGGTGWILEELTALHPGGLKITYIDISANMIARSKKRNTGSNEVTFINSPIQTAALTKTYDVVLTPFLFDNFSEPILSSAFQNIHNHLKKNGLWLFADFQLTDDKKTAQKIMLQVMYAFFRISCGIEAYRLPDTDKYFTTYHYHLVAEKTFLGKFIVSKIFRQEY
jgi:ubiquinone/menaquinone biosynthesis C-methylase UbiE